MNKHDPLDPVQDRWRIKSRKSIRVPKRRNCQACKGRGITMARDPFGGPSEPTYCPECQGGAK